MASTSAEQQSSILRPDRSKTPATYFHSPQPYRRHDTARISRNRSTSALSLSDLNRQALWEAATGRSYRSTPPEKTSETTSSPLPSLSEHLASSSIKSVPSLTSSLSPVSTPPPFDIFSPPEPAVVSIEHTPAILGHSIPEESLEASMEFMMPAQYGNYGTYAGSYQSNYMDQYSGDEQQSITADTSDHQSSYTGSYAPSPALPGASPAMSTRGGSVESEHVPSFSYASYPYHGLSSLGPSSQSTSAFGYSSTQPQLPPIYASSYTPSSDPYAQGAYGLGAYTQASSSSSGYLPALSSGYGNHHYHSSALGHHHQHHGSTSSSYQGPDGVRVVDQPKEPRCHDHGCNGRLFSTHSNLLRHQREKSGTASKSTCPRCGAVFTRKTAMNGHIAHDKCKRKSGGGEGTPEK